MLTATRDFQHRGLSWSERAALGDLRAAFSPRFPYSVNLLRHGATLFGARKALALLRYGRAGQASRVLDYGCGTGRLLRYFAKQGMTVVGMDVTAEMLSRAKQIGLPANASLCLTDGVTIPLEDNSVDLIWVCGVLKYCLFPPTARCRGGTTEAAGRAGAVGNRDPEPGADSSAYRAVADEMFRVLRGGGFVVNYEMSVDAPARTFTRDFEAAGFATKQVRVLCRHSGTFERISRHRLWSRLPARLLVRIGKASAACRYYFDDPLCLGHGMLDYLFIWRKPQRP